MLVVEPASAEDAFKVAGLASKTLSETYGDNWVQEHLGRGETSLVARHVEDGEIVGFAIAEPDERLTMHLLALAVASEYRGLGLGRALLRGVEANAHAQGQKQIDLAVRIDDNAAANFYQANGYLPLGIEDHVYADGGDAVRMMRPVA